MTTQDELGQRGYQYKHGDRPLDGYTIERAAGRGGFGEVYYAHSDSGREVALKVVNTYEQVELRGISQCMNLKNPHLVTIFDVKYGSDGRPWVIMEYVSGPSLREILDASPSGLGGAKAAFFLREVGKGLTYLHDCGIVHRDLKPGNIFYENGYVKIGDYGLSKAMSMTRHSGQTVAVGTLHYMAPEIGEGKYDRSIDIYALGALLYEMLTGQVPFIGSSPAEVLLKHLRTEVNLEGLEEPFKSVIRKAMAKNPDERYRSVQEMVEAVFGSEDIRNSVSQVSPASLTMMGGQVGKNVGAENIGSGNVGPGSAPTLAPEDFGDQLRERIREGRNRLRLALKMKCKPGWTDLNVATEPDRLKLPVRAIMAVGVAFAVSIVAQWLDHRDPAVVFWLIVVSSGAAVLAWRFVGRSVQRESDWVRRLSLGTPVAIAAWMCAMSADMDSARAARGVLAICATLFLMCWGSRLSPARKERVSVGQAFSAGLCAFILCMILGVSAGLAIAVAVGASLATNLFAPWGRRLVPQPGAAAALPGNPNRPISPGAPGIKIPEIRIPEIKIPPIPPIPALGGNRPFQTIGDPNARGQAGNQQMPPWAIVAIVLGTVGIVFGSVFRLPELIIPAIIVIIFGMIRSTRQQPNPAALPGSFPGSFSGRSSFGEVAASAAHGLAATVGGFFLIASIILALAAVVDLPGLIQSPIVNPEARTQLHRALGDDWPRVMREISIAACVGLGWTALLFTLLGRRWGGGIHMIRAIVGVGVLFAAIGLLRHALPDWGSVVPHSKMPADVVDAFLQKVDVREAAKSAGIFLVGWVILVWPARRREKAMPFQPASPAPAPQASSPEAKGKP